MHKNSSLLETFYLRDEKHLLDECRKRNIEIGTSFLKVCREYSLISPVLNLNGMLYYDIFQIPFIAHVFFKARSSSNIKKKLSEIRPFLEQSEKILPLLYQIRYFYHREIYGFATSGMLPPFKLSKEQVFNYSRDFTGIFYDALKKYRPKKYLEDFGIDAENLVKIRDELFLFGYRIDPMAKWYPFIRTVRRADASRFEMIEKEVLLAHDFYILAEVLTLFYRATTNHVIPDPEDILDLDGGKWKIKNCQECHKEMQVKNLREKYCSFCKKKIVANNGVKSKCRKCGKPFYKYVDGNEIANKPFQVGKKPKNGAEIITKAKLHYGRMVVYTQCECGTLNYETIEKGWF